MSKFYLEIYSKENVIRKVNEWLANKIGGKIVVGQKCIAVIIILVQNVKNVCHER